jgi:hypothetical protein
MTSAIAQRKTDERALDRHTPVRGALLLRENPVLQGEKPYV